MKIYIILILLILLFIILIINNKEKELFSNNKNIFLLANNPDVLNILNRININQNDLLITFNNCRFLKNINKIKNHKNKIHIIRTAKDYLHKQNLNCDYYKNCKEIIILSYTYKNNIRISNKINKFKNKCKIKNLKLINIKKDKKLNNIINIYYKNKNQSPQTGFVSFHYLNINKNIIKNYNKIYLLGFTGDYSNQKNNLWNGHNNIIEQKYFNNLIKINKNIIKIDK